MRLFARKGPLKLSYLSSSKQAGTYAWPSKLTAKPSTSCNHYIPPRSEAYTAEIMSNLPTLILFLSVCENHSFRPSCGVFTTHWPVHHGSLSPIVSILGRLRHYQFFSRYPLIQAEQAFCQKICNVQQHFPRAAISFLHTIIHHNVATHQLDTNALNIL